MQNLLIRKVEERDIASINRIYNEAILLGTATAHLELLPIDYHKEWFLTHKTNGDLILVAEVDGKIIGWNSLSPYRQGRGGLKRVKETSYYIDKKYWRQGIASILMEKVLEQAKIIGIETLVTFIMDANPVSVRLMDKFGFKRWGRLPSVIQTDKGSFDHLIFGKKI